MKLNTLGLFATGALLGASVGFSETLTWTGGAGDQNWDTAGNWSPAQVPGAGDAVVVQSASAPIVVAQPTAQLASLELSNSTLCLTNWLTCVQAESVVVGDGGVLTAGGPSTDAKDGDGVYTEASRVWVRCGDFTLATGGMIDMNGRGFKGVRQGNVYGPANAWGVEGKFGSSHGGSATAKYTDTGRQRIFSVYDSIEAPVEPAPGCTGWNTQGGHGGGVVRIEATGVVSVYGSILADGDGFAPPKPVNSSAAAGGSIYITCEKFLGRDGTLSARGGAGMVSTEKTPMNGAGGRISVVYSTDEQPTDAISGMVFDAGCGNLDSHWAISNVADCGTLYFPDSKLFASQDGAGFGGQLYVPDFNEYTTRGDLTIRQQLRLREEGFKLTVSGDLIIEGPAANLSFGGAEIVFSQNNAAYNRYCSGTTAWELSVAGNMTLGNGARFEGYPAIAAMVDEASAYGGFVHVGGKLWLNADSAIISRSDPTNGASIAYSAGSVTIDAGATVSAIDFGWENDFGTSIEKTPGSGGVYGVGGGYGGLGGQYQQKNGVVTFGKTYGDPLRPWQPGSGGTSWSMSRYTRGGGGAIRITSKGPITLNGTMNASAGSAGVGANSCDSTWCTGSGGSIFLECSRFAGTGSLIADGGSNLRNSRVGNLGMVAAGGGGRIAVYTGVPYDPATMSDEYILRLEDTPPDSFTGTTSVAGGLFTLNNDRTDLELYCGQEGTVRFIHVGIPYTVILLK